MARMSRYRPDREGPHRSAYEKNRKIILATQDVCGICGRPVDKSIPFPDPMAPVVDHIVPVDKGGHPSAIENLQLAHSCCNRAKSDKLYQEKEKKKVSTNRNLPQSFDWIRYKA